MSLHLGTSDDIFRLLEDRVSLMINNLSIENLNMLWLWADFILSAMNDEKKAVIITPILQTDKLIGNL